MAGAYREALFHGFKIFLDIFELLRLQYIGEHIKTVLAVGPQNAGLQCAAGVESDTAAVIHLHCFLVARNEESAHGVCVITVVGCAGIDRGHVVRSRHGRFLW